MKHHGWDTPSNDQLAPDSYEKRAMEMAECGSHVSAAIRLARAPRPYKLTGLDDPAPPENVPAIGRVQNNTVTTIATGENHHYRIDFEASSWRPVCDY